jgi:hypothetical protein
MDPRHDCPRRNDGVAWAVATVALHDERHGDVGPIIQAADADRTLARPLAGQLTGEIPAGADVPHGNACSSAPFVVGLRRQSAASRASGLLCGGLRWFMSLPAPSMHRDP